MLLRFICLLVKFIDFELKINCIVFAVCVLNLSKTSQTQLKAMEQKAQELHILIESTEAESICPRVLSSVKSKSIT